MAITKATENSKSWWWHGEIETHISCRWECKVEGSLWTAAWQFFRKLNVLSFMTVIPLLGELKMVSHENLHMSVHSRITPKSWKEGKNPKYPSTDEWTNKMCYMHITEYYIIIKRKEGLVYDTTWMIFMIVLCVSLTGSQVPGYMARHYFHMSLWECFLVGLAFEL